MCVESRKPQLVKFLQEAFLPSNLEDQAEFRLCPSKSPKEAADAGRLTGNPSETHLQQERGKCALSPWEQAGETPLMAVPDCEN